MVLVLLGIGQKKFDGLELHFDIKGWNFSVIITWSTLSEVSDNLVPRFARWMPSNSLSLSFYLTQIWISRILTE